MAEASTTPVELEKSRPEQAASVTPPARTKAKSVPPQASREEE